MMIRFAAAVLLAAGMGMAVAPPPEAAADVCGNVGGRHVSVSGCTDVAGAIADWAPPPESYAPLPQDYESTAPPPPPPPPPPQIGSNVSVCGNVGGPRGHLSVGGCT
jgi:hypothetical protein